MGGVGEVVLQRFLGVLASSFGDLRIDARWRGGGCTGR